MQIYHRVPEKMQGTILYPLNELKEKYPAIYIEQANKYKGREALMQAKILPLNCLWNDVLHFSAVHPKDIKKALIEAGASQVKTWRFFEINAAMLDLKKTVTYLYEPGNIINKINQESFIDYNPENIKNYSKLSEATKNYYKEIVQKGEKPLLFHWVTHVLYKGSIDTNGLKIVTV